MLQKLLIGIGVITLLSFTAFTGSTAAADLTKVPDSQLSQFNKWEGKYCYPAQSVGYGQMYSATTNTQQSQIAQAVQQMEGLQAVGFTSSELIAATQNYYSLIAKYDTCGPLTWPPAASN